MGELAFSIGSFAVGAGVCFPWRGRVDGGDGSRGLERFGTGPFGCM